MALTKAQSTRLDQLRSSLQLAQATTTAQLAPPSDRPYFTRQPDGSVYDRNGTELRGPLVPLGHK